MRQFTTLAGRLDLEWRPCARRSQNERIRNPSRRYQFRGLVQAPGVPIFELPPWSLAAVDVPDSGTASALVYGEAQHAKGIGAEALDQSAGTIAANDGGAGLPSRVCAARAPMPQITTNGIPFDHRLAFGSGPGGWGTFTFAGGGQPTPTVTLAADGNGFSWHGELVAPLEFHSRLRA